MWCCLREVLSVPDQKQAGVWSLSVPVILIALLHPDSLQLLLCVYEIQTVTAQNSVMTSTNRSCKCIKSAPAGRIGSCTIIAVSEGQLAPAAVLAVAAAAHRSAWHPRSRGDPAGQLEVARWDHLPDRSATHNTNHNVRVQGHKVHQRRLEAVPPLTASEQPHELFSFKATEKQT